MASTRTCERCGGPLRTGAPKAQRWCSKRCSAEDKKEANLTAAIAVGRTRPCEWCGTHFVVNLKFRAGQRWCTEPCRKSGRAEAGWVTRTCIREECGEPFTVKASTIKRSDQRYCSHRCAMSDVPTCAHCHVRLTRERLSSGFCSGACELDRRLLEEAAAGLAKRARCGRCQEVKLAEDFHKERGSTHGLSSACKACTKDKYEADKDAYRRRAFLQRGGSPQRAVSFTAQQKAARWAMWGGRCWICGIAEATQEDHVKPVSAGGWDCLSNLRPVCGPCNTRKRGAWPLSADEARANFRHPKPRPGLDRPLNRVGRAIATCQRCEKQWETQAHRARKQKYCGKECRDDAVGAATASRTFGSRRCELCGAAYTSKASKQRFCGRWCRERAQGRRRSRATPGQEKLF